LDGKNKTDPKLLLNDLGRNSWELVSVVPLSQVGGGTTTKMEKLLVNYKIKILNYEKIEIK
jgi:hypothetical protein